MSARKVVGNVADDNRDGLIRALVSFGRADLELVASLAIDRMDALDGDSDLEPEIDHCEASDDGCGPVVVNGIRHWGSEWDAEESFEASEQVASSLHDAPADWCKLLAILPPTASAVIAYTDGQRHI